MMGRAFGPSQLYAVEDIVNEVADVLVHVGFEVGEDADEQNWDGKALADMSGVLDRLKDAERQVATAIGLIRAYEMYREALAVSS